MCAACEELNDWRVVVSLFQFVARGLPRKSPVVSAPANYTAPIVQLQYRRRDLSPGSETRQRWIAPDSCCWGKPASTDSLALSHSRSAAPEERARAVCHQCPTHSGRPNCQTRRREADSHRPLAATPQAASTSSHVRWPALSDPIVAGSRSCPPSEGAADPTRAPIRTAQRAVGVFDSQALLAP